MKSAISLVVLISILLSASYSFSQETIIKKRPKNNLYGSLYQDAAGISMSYERFINTSDYHFFAVKLGIGINAEDKEDKWFDGYHNSRFLVVPVGFSTNIGTGIHFVEIGIGASYLKDQVNSRDMLLYYPTLGYRIQFKHSLRPSFKINATIPRIGDKTKKIYESIIGISFGVSI